MGFHGDHRQAAPLARRQFTLQALLATIFAMSMLFALARVLAGLFTASPWSFVGGLACATVPTAYAIMAIGGIVLRRRNAEWARTLLVIGGLMLIATAPSAFLGWLVALLFL